MHRERLNKLADLLDNYREDSGVEFTLSRWNYCEPVIKGHLWWKKYGARLIQGCAVGLAMEDRWFQDQGLMTVGLYCREPVFGGETRMDAVAAFFDISFLDANRFFCKEYYGENWPRGESGAKTVAARIREFTRMLPEELTKLQHTTEKLEELEPAY